MKFKLPSLSTIIFCIIIYKCFFGGDGDEQVTSGTGGGGEPRYADDAKEIIDHAAKKAAEVIESAKEKYDKIKEEKEETKEEKPSNELPSLKPNEKENEPMFKSID